MAKKLFVLFLIQLSLVVGNSFDLTVSREGSGNFTSIQQAIDAAPNYGKIRFQIKIKAGTYGFFMVPRQKSRLSLIGDGADVTIVTGSQSNGTGFPTQATASAQIFGDEQLYYREYNNRGPGTRTDGRVKWKGYRIITNVSEAVRFTVRNFINGIQWLPSTEIPFFLDLIRA